jgi:hypothetical protein
MMRPSLIDRVPCAAEWVDIGGGFNRILRIDAEPPVVPRVHRPWVRRGRSLRSGGRLVFACWQELVRNDWLLLPGLAAAQYLPLPESASGGPGPFSLADRDALTMLLESVGFHDVDISGYEVPMLLGGGGTLDDALTFLLNSGAARAMFDGGNPTAVEHATAAVRTVLADHYESDGVRLGAATWIVSAKVSS